MALPGINIIVNSDGLGSSVSVADGICGIILSGPAPSNLFQSAPKAVFSIADVEALGINRSYDHFNGLDSYSQLKDFYDLAPKGTELLVMVIPQTTTLESACDRTNNIVRKMLNEAEGRINLWGIHRIPAAGYIQTTADGLDDDVGRAVLKADALCGEFANAFSPCRALIGARGFAGDIGSLKDFRANDNPRTAVFIGSLSESGHPAVGFILGKLASIPVQRKASRVKDGNIGRTPAYLSDGNRIEDYKDAMDTLHDKGYMFFRTIENKSGYYVSSDPTCVANDNDFSSIARGRVIDKAIRITHNVYAEEIEDDIDIDPSGYLPAAVVKDYQAKIQSSLELEMADNLSSTNPVVVEIDPEQNVLATDRITIDKLAVRPKGYASNIEINLGFENPQNN